MPKESVPDQRYNPPLRTPPLRPSDPRKPDHTRSGIFVYHNCWKCWDGQKPCANADGPNTCQYPVARND